MSCYIVKRRIIDFLVQAGTTDAVGSTGEVSEFSWYYDGENKVLYPEDDDRAREVGQMLWDENVKSVRYRYSEKDLSDLPGPFDENFVYLPNQYMFGEFDPVQVIKTSNCYSYQSCEHPGWEESEAKEFVSSMIHQAVVNVDGYDEAEWGVPDPVGKTITDACSEVKK